MYRLGQFNRNDAISYVLLHNEEARFICSSKVKPVKTILFLMDIKLESSESIIEISKDLYNLLKPYGEEL
jgi:hypothetical protein